MEEGPKLPLAPHGYDEPPVPIGCQTQPSEPVGDKNRVSILALKRAVFAGLGEHKGEVGREPRTSGEQSYVWVLVQFRQESS
jgi:hypothetical protein